MTEKHHISLNNQFTIVLNGIIFFPVPFCDNSLLVLKMPFQVYSFTSKKVQVFFNDRKMLLSLLSLLFEISTFSQDIWGNIHCVCKINLISYGTLIKALYLPSKTNLKKSETQFCRRKTAKDGNVKINVSSNIPCTFLLFEANAFLQIFFPKKNWSFENVSFS